DAHQRHIHVQVVRQPRAHATDFLVRAGAHQPLRAARHRGHIRRIRHHLLRAAVVAKPRTIRDVPLAAVANHKSLPAGRAPPALPKYTPKQAKKLRQELAARSAEKEAKASQNTNLRVGYPEYREAGRRISTPTAIEAAQYSSNRF